MIKKCFVVIYLNISVSFIFAQEKKVANAVRVTNPPKLDGLLDDECWKNIVPAKDFFQLEPYNGKPASWPSEIKIAYDDKAIYVGAMLYDNYPDSILKQYTPRDEINISDFFGIYIDPFNTGLTAYGFFVTPVNVQIDMKAEENGHEDENWNAVWKSETRIIENGWCVEYRIPYSALRFPKTPVQTWGLNFFRKIERYRENTSWSFIDSEKQGWINQQGELHGIKNVDPPVRLSVTPYLSAYMENNPENQGWENFYRAGMDLKYGLTESFTLDMMLVPDFGQVQSDDVVLNLSPFEVFYNEQRQFFIEGAELFSRADVFYSRRIGARPDRFWEVEDQLVDNERVIENPTETQLINATKISGRTSKGLGVGFLNAMTLNTYAKIRDTITGDEREFLTQPFTNYNLLSFDQSLKNNSYVSIINTNVSRFDDKYYANVTGGELMLNNKSKTYSIFAKGAISQINEKDEDLNWGYYSYISFSKTSGKFRFSLSNLIESDTYNPNDLGYLQNNNEVSNYLNLSYNIYKPFGRFLRLYNRFGIGQQSLYNPDKFVHLYFDMHSFGTFRNHLSAGYYVFIRPIDRHDYFEPRVDGRVFIEPAEFYGETWISTDFRKKFAIELRVGGSPKNEYGTTSYDFKIEPRFKPNDRLLLVFETSLGKNINNIGFVDYTENEDTIYFGKRDRLSIENEIESRYIFNENASLSFKLRHYWSTVDYDDFYVLNNDGSLVDDNSYSDNANINFNYFTIDLAYRWIFAPGSEMSIVWKNSIFTESDEIEKQYFDNLSNTFRANQTNSFSIRILYYLDYVYLKRKK
jgi:hypothetical protein